MEASCYAGGESIWWRRRLAGGLFHHSYGAKKAGETPALRNSTRSGFAGLRNPFANLFFQNIERESSVPEDDIVKRADIEFRSEFFFSQRAKLLNFQLADLVRECLPGPCNVAIDFAGHEIPRRIGPGAVHIIDGFLTGPALRVNSRVDDEARGAK